MDRTANAMTPVGGRAVELAALVGLFKDNVRDLLADLAINGTSRELIDAAGLLEEMIRAAEQASASVVDAVDRRGLYLDDGHVHVKAWLKASVQMGPADLVRRCRIAKLCRCLPHVGEALAAGRVGVGQVNRMALTWSNPRVREEFEATVAAWLVCAEIESFEQFDGRLSEWERLTDEDGGHRDREEGHASRDCRFNRVGDRYFLRGQFSSLQGEVVEQIFSAFVDCEYRADGDDAKRRFGVDHVNAAQLARSPGQRRADAIVNLATAAASAPLDGRPVDVTVDIVVDQATFERQLLERADPLHRRRVEPPSASCGFDGALDSSDASTLQAMCRTVRGTPVDPIDAVSAALIGRVRRVVIGAKSLVIDLGATGRLFTGSARDAVYVQAAIDRLDRCLWPACDRRPRQLDHTIPRSEGGATAPWNGGPACGHHNLIKCQGYTTRRDDRGRWHTFRPDGSEICAH